MFLSILIYLCIILFGVLIWLRPKTRGNKKLPGPTPLPILGNLLQIGFRPHITFAKWAEYYGPIFRIKLGFKDAIVVNDYKLIKELLSDTASTGRLGDNPVWMESTKGPYGTGNSSGSNWEAQRIFTLRILRSYGFAKTSMETMILDEVQIMLNWFRNKGGSPVSVEQMFTSPVINSLWRIVSGERCEWEKSTPPIMEATENFFREFLNVASNGLMFAPLLRLIVPNLFGWNRYVKSVNKMIKFFQDSIAQHEETFNPTELRDYLDHHLLAIRNESDPNSSFYKDTGRANMIGGVVDLFVGGSQTTSITLSWAMLYLSEYENIQKSLQKEIDQVLGSNLPSLSNRANMPLCEALILEILRITSIAPIGVPHTMLSDSVFYGYHLPVGTMVFANIYAVHHNPEIWGDPENFRPERFLNADKSMVVRNKALIPFAEGKRKCIGESFALNNLFLFVTSICQNFHICPDPDIKEKVNFEPEPGLVQTPKPFRVLFSPRKC